MKKALPYLIPLLLLASLVSLHFLIPDTLQALRYRYFDLLQRLHPRIYRQTPVTVVDLDDATLEKFGQWPWPRIQTAELIRKIHEAGARVIAFDIIFAEPDRTSPKNILPLWPKIKTSKLAPELETLPDHDEEFARAIQGANVVTAWSLNDKYTPYMPALKEGFSFAGDDPRLSLPNFPGAVKTLTGLEDAAAGNGVINFFAEYDAIVRHIPLVFQLRGQLFPSLVSEAIRLHEGAKSYIVKSTAAGDEKNYGSKPSIVSLKIGNHVIPTDEQGRLWIYDTGYAPERVVPAWKILEGRDETKRLKDSIVFIGTSAAGLKDLRTSPLNPVAAGVELHAQLAEQILLGEFLYRPDWARGAEVLFMILVGLVLILSMPRLGAAWSALFGGLSFAGIFAVSWIVFIRRHGLIDPLLPSSACLAIYISSSLIHYLRTDLEKRHIRNAFSRYLAPQVVEQLAESPDQLRLGGEMRKMTLLFADIQGFTAISENFSPSELTTFINRFLTPMTDIILKHKGTIDKYMGDCIMAFWNAPLPDPDDERHACEAALEMQKYLRNRKEIPAAKDGETVKFPHVRLGIGLNTGDCCVGNMGSDQRFDYSVLGDSVNLASRLEGLCRLYGLEIIIGETTAAAVRSFAMLEADLVKVKGKSQAARIYALLGGPEMNGNSLFRSLEEKHKAMLAAYKKQEWKKALTLAQECRAMKVPGVELEKLYELYISRIESYERFSPGPDWDGVSIAAVK